MELFKTNTFRSKKYLDFVRGVECCVCGRKDETVIAHHVDTGGMSLKCSDALTIPLCHTHHAEAHSGKHTFFLSYGTTKEECLARTMQAYIEEGR